MTGVGGFFYSEWCTAWTSKRLERPSGLNVQARRHGVSRSVAENHEPGGFAAQPWLANEGLTLLEQGGFNVGRP
jgi:hypothetical protein